MTPITSQHHPDPTLVPDPKTGVLHRPKNTRAIIYPDGRVVQRQSALSLQDIEDVICQGLTEGSPRVLTTVNLRDGHVMLVHDLGHDLQLQPNEAGTAIYRSMCPGGSDWVIVGTVVVAPDEDFA